jgi:hypothetical protein
MSKFGPDVTITRLREALRCANQRVVCGYYALVLAMVSLSRENLSWRCRFFAFQRASEAAMEASTAARQQLAETVDQLRTEMLTITVAADAKVG